MKKIIFSFFLIFLSLLSKHSFGEVLELKDSCFTGAFSAGYVFKRGCTFKEVYGNGIVNVITADGCYYPWKHWGIGTKISYWRGNGRTTFLKKHSVLQEVPLTFYLRRTHDFRCGLQTYASLGGGIAWIREHSYLGKACLFKGIGEAEVGINYPIWRCLNLTGAFRYLFPRQSQRDSTQKVDVGGFDLRAGIEFPF